MADKKISLPYVDKKVEALLLWRDPVKSGIIFGSITLAYLVLEWSGLTLVTLLSYAVLAAVSGAWAWSNIGGMIGRTGPPIPKFLKEGFTEEEARVLVEKARPVVNKGLAVLAKVAEGKDIKITGVVVAAAWFLARLGRLFSIVGLAYTVVLLAFSLPILYELKKDDIDKYAKIALEKGKELAAKAQTYVPKATGRSHQE